MSDPPAQIAEWYYVGHYGQLGPLTSEQVLELCRDGVIDGETFVWHPGLPNWQPASGVAELKAYVTSVTPTPPPPPGSKGALPPTITSPSLSISGLPMASGLSSGAAYPSTWSTNSPHIPKSDKSRVTAGLLNFLPGFGRFYLGYSAHGALQLITSFCVVGYIWSALDAVYILSGGVKYDGYGRILDD